MTSRRKPASAVHPRSTAAFEAAVKSAARALAMPAQITAAALRQWKRELRRESAAPKGARLQPVESALVIQSVVETETMHLRVCEIRMYLRYLEVMHQSKIEQTMALIDAIEFGDEEPAAGHWTLHPAKLALSFAGSDQCAAAPADEERTYDPEALKRFFRGEDSEDGEDDIPF